MTETGSAPTGSYLPLAFEGGNYKVSAGDLGLGGAGQKLGVYTEATQSVPSSSTNIVAGELGTANIARVAFAFTILQSFGSSYYYGAIEGTLIRSYHTNYSVMFVGTYRLAGEGLSAGGAAYLGTSTAVFNPSVNHSSSFAISSSQIQLVIDPSSSSTIWYSYLA